MKLAGLTHPKTKELAYTLSVPLPHAIGLLELLWAFCAEQTPRGNVGRWSNAVIAGEAGWDKDADEFIDALVTVGFLDENDEHRLVVHDWEDHAPRWVFAKLKKTHKKIIRDDLSGDLSVDLSRTEEGKQEEAKEGATRHATPRHATPRHATSREEKEPDGSSGEQNSPAAYSIPLTRGKIHSVTAEDLAHYRETYPAVDVDQSFRNMLEWLKANPKRRSGTAKGAKQRITNWLSRDQDRAAKSGPKKRSDEAETWLRGAV